MNQNNIISASCLLLTVAKSDEKIDTKELNIIKEIIIDFFNIKYEDVEYIIEKSKKIIADSFDIFEFGRDLNEVFSYQDKIDFICCTFEVAYIDKELHYLEEYSIKKIASILNVKHTDLINSKNEIKKYLD
tara:strand:+ start:480 stop:872 length:393 start_codon:yes stop_codon:yes gene_type:complete